MISGATAVYVRQKPQVIPRLAARSSKGVEEALSLLGVKAEPRMFPPGQGIICEGRRSNSLFILVEGIAISYRILRDAQRQVLGIIIPGDFAGSPSCFFKSALY